MLIFLINIFLVTVEEADEYFYNRDYKKALSLYLEVVKKEKSPGVVFNIGICYEKLGNLNKALSYYKQAKELGWKPAESKILTLQKLLFKDTLKKEKPNILKKVEVKKKEPEKSIVKVREEKPLKKETPVFVPKKSGKPKIPFSIYIIGLIAIAGIAYAVSNMIISNKNWNMFLRIVRTNDKGFVGMKRGNIFGIFFYSSGKINRALVEVKKDGKTRYLEDEKALLHFFGKRNYRKHLTTKKSEWREFADSFIELFKES